MEESKKPEKVAPPASRIFWVVLTPALGTLIYSFLHLTGAVYSQTILEHYGIPLGAFPKTSTDYMFSAYSALLQTGLNWINVVRDPEIVLSMLALTTLVMAEIALLNWLPKSSLAEKFDGLIGARWMRKRGQIYFRASLPAPFRRTSLGLRLLAPCRKKGQ
ncbi:hypothetical protein V8Z77_12305 [Stutzerimonas stutzeri]|uniref:hypothetical protein n=1 Tax=Stutzerimonas stutzeri TaxID=316 RepID=UPI00101AD78E|nr:hypothetical protein [Stutzerimonas stutzeri]